MWHRRSRRRLGLVREHRIALLRNLVIGLVQSHRIRTTYPRAKEASRFADKLVTIAKRGNLHARRLLISKLSSPLTAKKLVEEIGPVFKDQQGGYTRVLRYDFRPGDGAEMAFLEFTKLVEKPTADGEKQKKKKKEKKEEGKPAVSVEKPTKPKKSSPKKPRAEEASVKEKQEETRKKESLPETQGKKEGSPLKEEPKKGGFLGNLRKFLTGE